MGKSKNSNRSEIEYLRGELRRAQKKLKNAEKHHRIVEEYDPLEEPIADTSSDRDYSICPKCNTKNSIKILDLGIKSYEICNSCNYRGVLKK